MAREKFERTKPHVNIGTIGHVDHGKVRMIQALLDVAATKKAAPSFGNMGKTIGLPEGEIRREQQHANKAYMR